MSWSIIPGLVSSAFFSMPFARRPLTALVTRPAQLPDGRPGRRRRVEEAGRRLGEQSERLLSLSSSYRHTFSAAPGATTALVHRPAVVAVDAIVGVDGLEAVEAEIDASDPRRGRRRS